MADNPIKISKKYETTEPYADFNFPLPLYDRAGATPKRSKLKNVDNILGINFFVCFGI